MPHSWLISSNGFGQEALDTVFGDGQDLGVDRIVDADRDGG